MLKLFLHNCNIAGILGVTVEKATIIAQIIPQVVKKNVHSHNLTKLGIHLPEFNSMTF